MKSHIGINIKQTFASSGPEIGFETACGSRRYYSAFRGMNAEEERRGGPGTP